MSWLQIIDIAACSLIVLGCIHIGDKAGRMRPGGARFFAYELYRVGYWAIGAFAACNMLGMLPGARGTIIEYYSHAPGVAMRAGLGLVFAGRMIRTVFGGRGCLARR